MAKPISDEEVQLKKRARRRLIGAIVIVTVVVVVLPMVLDNEPKPLTQDIDIRIPSPESAGPFTSKVVPVPEAPGEKPSTAKPAPDSTPVPPSSDAKPAKPDASVASTDSTSKPGARPKSEKPAAAPAAEPPASKTAASPASSGKFVIQVVALSDAGKAKQMQQAVQKAGVSAYTEIVKTARGDVTRVRAGPFTTREAAEKAQKKLKSAGLEGKVVPAR